MSIQELAEQLRLTWNQATGDTQLSWDFMSHLAQKGYIAVARKAEELCAAQLDAILADKNATIHRLAEKLDNVEHLIPTMEMKRRLDAAEQRYRETQAECDQIRKTAEIFQAGNRSFFAENEDLKATVGRLREKLESLEPFIPTIENWKKLTYAIPPTIGLPVAEGALRYIEKLEQDLSIMHSAVGEEIQPKDTIFFHIASAHNDEEWCASIAEAFPSNRVVFLPEGIELHAVAQING